MGSFKIFFGKESLGTQKMTALLREVLKCMQKFKARMVLDEEFASKFLYAVDTRVQYWLQECRKARERYEVNDRILDFDDLIRDVLFNRSIGELPPSFTSVQRVEANAAPSREVMHPPDQRRRRGKMRMISMSAK